MPPAYPRKGRTLRLSQPLQRPLPARPQEPAAAHAKCGACARLRSAERQQGPATQSAAALRNCSRHHLREIASGEVEGDEPIAHAPTCAVQPDPGSDSPDSERLPRLAHRETVDSDKLKH